MKTNSYTEFIDITKDVQRVVDELNLIDGICYIYVPHTTAGVTINEGADPSVTQDMLKTLNKLIPFEDDYKHLEDNSAAHIKSTLTGVSVSCIIERGKLLLGSWQAIYFCEFDGPRSRKVLVKMIFK